MHQEFQYNSHQEQWHCQWQLPDIVTYTKVCEEGSLAATWEQWCVQEMSAGYHQHDGHQQDLHSYTNPWCYDGIHHSYEEEEESQYTTFHLPHQAWSSSGSGL